MQALKLQPAKVFAEDMERFIKEDGAGGLDCVLNSLSHDDYIPKSLGYLRKAGVLYIQAKPEGYHIRLPGFVVLH